MSLRRIDLSLRRVNDLHSPGDIAGKLGHDLKAFDILLYLAGIRAVDGPPSNRM